MKTRHTSFAVRVKKSSIDGFGVFAKKHFNMGDVIGVISGIVPEEIDWECFYTCTFEDEFGNIYSLEPTYPFKYLNHSKDANALCETPILVATRDIEPGEEITINYGGDWDEEEGEVNG